MNSTRSRRRTTQWNLFFHYVSIALAMVSGVVFVPLYLRFIPLELYGAWLATGNVVAWLTVIDPGLSTVLQQRSATAYGKGRVDELNALLTGGVLISAVISVAVLSVGIGTTGLLFDWLQLGGGFETATLERAYLLAVTGTALMIFSYGITAFNQGLQSSVAVGVIFVVSTVGSLVATAVFLYQGVGLPAIPLGLLVRGGGLTIGNVGYLAWRYRNETYSYRPSFCRVGTLSKLMSFTFLGRGANVIATNLDAFVLTRFLGAEVAPVLVLTRKAADISRTLADRPAVAFMPSIAHLVGSGGQVQARTILLRLVRLILWLLGLLGAGVLIFNGAFVTLWVGPTFYAGTTVNFLIAITLIVTVVSNMLSNLCFALGNIRNNSLAALAQGAVTIPLMICGAKYWGLTGVALAPLLAMLAVSGWYFPFAFSRLLNLTSADLRAITRESCSVLAAAALAGLLATPLRLSVEPTTWFRFATGVVAFAMLYAALLWLLSTAARAESARLLDRTRAFRTKPTSDALM